MPHPRVRGGVLIPYNYFIAGVIFTVAACTDFIDGHIARSRGLVTNLGKFLDPIADKVLVAAAFIFLLVRQGTLTVLWQGDWVLVYAGVCVAVILARELIVSGFRMVAASAGLVLAADKVGKVKTTFQDISIAMLLFGAVGGATALTIWAGGCYIVRNRAVFKES